MRMTHFWLWSLIFAALLWLIYRLLQKRSPGFGMAQLNLVAGPQLPALFLCYGAIFNPPNNMAAIDRHGFFGFWFSTFSAQEYNTLALEIATFVVIALALSWGGIVLARKYMAQARSASLGLLALVFWYLAGHCLRYVPDTILDSCTIQRMSVGQILSELGDSFYRNNLLWPFLLALLFAGTALYCTLRTTRPQ